MPRPSAFARTKLDESAQRLAIIGIENNLALTLEDFDPKNIAQAKRAERWIWICLFIWTAFFLVLILLVLILGVLPAVFPDIAAGGTQIQSTFNNPSAYVLVFSSLWFFAMGGLGAVTNLFSVFLQLRAPESLRKSDTFVINARIILGCIGSFVLSLTVLAPDTSRFFKEILSIGTLTGGWTLLIPFIVGFAIPLALALLQRLILTLEFFFGMSTNAGRAEQSRTRQRR